MKIVVAYDGSQSADAALDDLRQAGLPDNTEAVVMTVAEVWLPPPTGNGNGNGGDTNRYIDSIVAKHLADGKRQLAEAETLARHAGDRLRKMFPAWSVKAEATYGSPAWEIITRASTFGADLIVVGSHGRNAVGRLFLGSISQKVITEADCSVRVARGRIEVDPSPSRVLIGFDGSIGSRAAVEEVVRRGWNWPCEVRLAIATDQLVPTAIGRFVSPVVDWAEGEIMAERQMLEKMAEPAMRMLSGSSCVVNLDIVAGDPKQVLIAEAESWHADTIFVGANAAGGHVERFLLGSVSAAIAARAACSVEVIRHRA